MPLYDFKNTKTDEIEEHSVKLADYDQFVKDNPHLERQLSTPGLISATGNIINKTSTDWKNHLENIKKGAGRNNTIKT